jgi:hypothetical protein
LRTCARDCGTMHRKISLLLTYLDSVCRQAGWSGRSAPCRVLSTNTTSVVEPSSQTRVIASPPSRIADVVNRIRTACMQNGERAVSFFDLFRMSVVFGVWPARCCVRMGSTCKWRRRRRRCRSVNAYTIYMCTYFVFQCDSFIWR